MSTNGVKTSEWGPPAWKFLFCTIMTYPLKIDEKNLEHKKIKKHYKQMFMSLQSTLPCLYCRQSYSIFIKQDLIDEYLVSRDKLFLWLYKLKDKVNKKLINQELECYNNEYKKILNLLEKNKITKDKYKTLIKDIRKTIFITKQSPNIEIIKKQYEHYRAGCSKISKMCR
jgi:hypothetical protein